MVFTRIIFVCRDNMTLSPMAEAIFRSIYDGNPIEVASRGLVVLFEGPINPKVEVVLGSHGMTATESTTKALEDTDVHGDTLLLVMNNADRKSLRERFPKAHIGMLSELVDEVDIIDPYGGNLMDYEKCFGQLSVIIKKFTMKLES